MKGIRSKVQAGITFVCKSQLSYEKYLHNKMSGYSRCARRLVFGLGTGQW